MARPSITVLFPEREEALDAFLKRVASSRGEVVVLFSVLEVELLMHDEKREEALLSLKAMSTRTRLATRSRKISTAARTLGIRVIDRAHDLESVLEQHASFDDALREFQPHIWQKQLRNRLQAMGLLSLPRLRIWILICMSGILFSFVFFKLLPSATITVIPREDTISQTTNIFLAQTGAIATLPPRVRVMELVPVTVRIDRTITFDQISKDFIGENAHVLMKVINESDEPYWLKAGSRLVNEAGIIFRIQASIKVEPRDAVLVNALADDIDLYGEIIGSRGNIPAGLHWNFIALGKEEQQLVYAVSETEGSGGTNEHRTVLQRKDIDVGVEKLKEELLALAKQLVDERRELYNAEHSLEILELLYYEELTKVSYVDIVLPEQFVGEPVGSVPIEGSIIYTAYGYDTKEVLDLLSRELKTHVGEGRRLIEETLSLDRLVAHVIDYEDDLSWIKITVDLSGTQQYVLDPLSPTGAVFAKKVREHVQGLSLEDAKRIVNNFPEVERASVSLWPPWSGTLPTILSSIIVEPLEGE